MRILILSLLLFVAFANTTHINNKIKKTNNRLNVIKNQYKNTYRNFKNTANKIISEEKEISILSKKISKLKHSLKNVKKDAIDKRMKLIRYEKNYKITQQIKKREEEKLTDYIAKHLSFALVALKRTDEPKNVVTQEIFLQYNKIIKNQLNKLAKDINSQQLKIDQQSKNIKIVKSQLKKIDSELKKLNNMSIKKAKMVKNLKKRKLAYANELRNIKLKRRRLSSILRKLKIVKYRPKTKRGKKRGKKRAKKAVASSYQNVKTYNYHGARTIPPLRKFVVLRKYGPYKDPIYNIKVFNDSVVMKPIGRNQKVNAVLSGKVIFAKKTPSLKKVVIIQHKNKYHTIYAHLDKIAPTITKGRIVKKGFVIGKVNSSLTFQITKQNYYINPLKFIKY